MQALVQGWNKNTLKKIGSGIVLVVLVIAVVLALYFIQRNEGFENDGSSKALSNALIDATSLTPSKGECAVVLFYAPWCGHCKTFKPVFQEVMEELNGKKTANNKTLKIKMVNCDEEKELGKKYEVAAYPTVKILGDDGSVIEYEGSREKEALKKAIVSDN
jgi:protein disulfide-isomerase-like protein